MAALLSVHTVQSIVGVLSRLVYATEQRNSYE
jgi:hypothetical protein